MDTKIIISAVFDVYPWHIQKMLFYFIFINVILVINSSDGQIMVDWNSDPRLDSIRHYLNQRLQSEDHKWHSLIKNNHRLPNIIHSSAKNRSKSNGALFYNRIPKCGSSTVSVANFEKRRSIWQITFCNLQVAIFQ